jgi:hypothetical protein
MITAQIPFKVPLGLCGSLSGSQWGDSPAGKHYSLKSQVQDLALRLTDFLSIHSICHYKLILDWSWIHPKQNQLNSYAMEANRTIVHHLNNQKIQVTVVLSHLNEPEWMKKKGWAHISAVENYLTYARACMVEMAEYARDWISFQEINYHPDLLPLYGLVTEKSLQGHPAVVFKNLIAAHAKIYDLIKTRGNELNRVGLGIHLQPVVPTNPLRFKDVKICKRWNDLVNFGFLNIWNSHSDLPIEIQSNFQSLKSSLDFLSCSLFASIEGYENNQQIRFQKTHCGFPVGLAGWRLDPKCLDLCLDKLSSVPIPVNLDLPVNSETPKNALFQNTQVINEVQSYQNHLEGMVLWPLNRANLVRPGFLYPLFETPRKLQKTFEPGGVV